MNTSTKIKILNAVQANIMYCPALTDEGDIIIRNRGNQSFCIVTTDWNFVYSDNNVSFEDLKDIIDRMKGEKCEDITYSVINAQWTRKGNVLIKITDDFEMIDTISYRTGLMNTIEIELTDKTIFEKRDREGVLTAICKAFYPSNIVVFEGFRII